MRVERNDGCLRRWHRAGRRITENRPELPLAEPKLMSDVLDPPCTVGKESLDRLLKQTRLFGGLLVALTAAHAALA